MFSLDRGASDLEPELPGIASESKDEVDNMEQLEEFEQADDAGIGTNLSPDIPKEQEPIDSEVFGAYPLLWN